MAKHRRSRDSSARNLGFRGQRLEQLFREELNSILDDEIGDPRLEGTRVTLVELSRDGSRARVWFVTNRDGGGASFREIEAALERASGFFRSRLCDALTLKRIPELGFRHDPAAVFSPLHCDELF
jgi:ribosome-binding factor A